MAFITAANAIKIINRTELNSVELIGDVYEKQIHFFSKREKIELLAYKQLVENIERYVREVYTPIELKADSYSLVYEKDFAKPAFHKDLSCPRLNNDYENFTIPNEIRYKENGQLNFKKISEFRKWFPTVEHLFKNDKEAFVARLHLKFGIVTNPNALEADNSGPQHFVNYSIDELKEKIDEAIKNAGKYYYANEKNQKILSKFSKFSFLGFVDKPIRNNNTGYSDNQVKEFLRDYDTRFKKPLKKLLREYYRAQFNEDLNLDKEILKRLNFKPCAHCYGKSKTVEKIDLEVGQFKYHDKIVSNRDYDDDLPF